MTLLKSIGAIVAGFITVAGLSIVTDSVVSATGIFPPQITTGMLVFALLYRITFTVLGGYVTARLAPQSAMIHVWVLAGLGQLGGIAGVFAGWDLSAHWYPIMIAVTAIPAVVYGGFLRTGKVAT
jgi:hypothetical protein